MLFISSEKLFSFLRYLNFSNFSLFFHTFQGFPNGVTLWGEQFGQNGQKLHQNNKIIILGVKLGEGMASEDKPTFGVVREGERGNPVFQIHKDK